MHPKRPFSHPRISALFILLSGGLVLASCWSHLPYMEVHHFCAQGDRCRIPLVIKACAVRFLVFKLVLAYFFDMDSARIRLCSSPQAFNRLPGAALPHPFVDPNPRLTNALYTLWFNLQSVLDQDPSRAVPGLALSRGQPLYSVARAFELFGRYLVSFKLLLF
jgi:hypothetical protein